MAITFEELSEMRDALVRARASGVREFTYGGKRTVYQDDAGMAAALADLEARIARASAPRSGVVTFVTSKGV